MPDDAAQSDSIAKSGADAPDSTPPTEVPAPRATAEDETTTTHTNQANLADQSNPAEGKGVTVSARPQSSSSKDYSVGTVEYDAGDYGSGGPAEQQLEEAVTVISLDGSSSSSRPRRASEQLAERLLGTTLDQFRLDEFVGGGGMGAVFRATDLTLNRQVAVKVLVDSGWEEVELTKRFRNEAQSAARLDHPNIARVHYVGETKDLQYIVFEYVRGKNLREMVQLGGALPLDDALYFTVQLAEALAHAWQRDVVHRDIKPSNVLITDTGQVKLVDMGLARLHDVAAADRDLTASGMTLGTFDYISPEQARDPRGADARSDIYSLGCTLYFMLSGKPPYPEGTALQKLLMHQGDPLPKVSATREDIPPQVDVLLERMAAKSPQERFQNPAEVIAAVSSVAESMGIALPTHGSSVQLSLSPTHPTWMRSAIPWAVPAALLLAISVLLEVLGSANQNEEPLFQSTKFEPLNFAATAAEEGTPSSEGSETSPPNESTSGTAMTNDEASPTLANENASTLLAMLRERLTNQPTELSGDSLPEEEMARWLPVVLWPSSTSTLQQQLGLFFSQLSRGQGGDGTISLPPEPPLDQSRRLVVTDSLGTLGSSPNTYRTLRAACNEARDGDIILLRLNESHRIDMEDGPIRIRGKRVTIQGAEGYRARIVIDPEPDVMRLESKNELFVVRENGELFIEGVEFSVALESQFTPWHFIHALDANQIVLRDFLLEVHALDTTEAMAPGAVVLLDSFDSQGLPNLARRDIRPEESRESARMARLSWENVSLHGLDSLLDVRGGRKFAFHWRDGAATCGAFAFRLDVRAARNVDQLPLLDLVLDNALVHARQGIFLVEAGPFGDEQSQLRITARNCLLSGREGSTLVEQRGEVSSTSWQMTPRLWSGTMNDLAGFAALWRHSTQSVRSVNDEWDYQRWETYWNNQELGQNAETRYSPTLGRLRDYNLAAWQQLARELTIDEIRDMLFDSERGNINATLRPTDNGNDGTSTFPLQGDSP